MPLGTDYLLKEVLARCSTAAARELGDGCYRPCSDGRVRRALQAALADDAVQGTAREQLLKAVAAVDPAQLRKGETRRSERLELRVTTYELDLLRERATLAQCSVSEYMRRRALGY